jgi:uncharacterized membrane protein
METFSSISLSVIIFIISFISDGFTILKLTLNALSLIFTNKFSLELGERVFESLAPITDIVSSSEQTIAMTMGPITGPLPASSIPQHISGISKVSLIQ